MMTSKIAQDYQIQTKLIRLTSCKIKPFKELTASTA